MTAGQCIIAGLIVAGWGIAAVVAYCIARDNRKKTDRIYLINQKNGLLSEVEKLSLMRLEHFAKSEDLEASKIRVHWKVEDLRKIYGRLECEEAVSKIGELRQLVTVGVEDAANYTPEQTAAKQKAIRDLVAELESIPAKRF